MKTDTILLLRLASLVSVLLAEGSRKKLLTELCAVFDFLGLMV
jgi:hypothetical protein